MWSLTQWPHSFSIFLSPDSTVCESRCHTPISISYICPRCSVILPGYWKIPGYLTKNTRVFFSTPVLLTNTRVFSIKYPGIWQPVKYPGKWQLMTAETTCGLFRRISGVLSFTDFSLSSSLMLVIFIQLFLS